jgi:hypothetical protein
VSPDAHDGSGQLRPEAAEALAALRAKLAETPYTLRIGHVHTVNDDMQAFLELPDCEACGGTGKDDHASPFEAPLAVHFAGMPVKAEGRRRQLCMWCGHILSDIPSRKGESLPPAWLVGTLVRVEDGIAAEVDYEPGGELPPGCCALPDDEPADDGRCSKCAAPRTAFDPFGDGLCKQHLAEAYPASAATPTPWGRCPNNPPCEHPSFIHDVSGDPEDPKPMCCADGCRCGRPDPGPDEAQETRAAADWPAEPHDDDRCGAGCGNGPEDSCWHSEED